MKPYRGSLVFSRIVAELPVLLDRLLTCAPVGRDRRSRLPREKGVYVLFRGNTPTYVGRADDIRRRLSDHWTTSALHTRASFAFLVARRKALESGIETRGMTRKVLQSDKKFAPLFSCAKEEIGAMTVRYVEVGDARTQAVFEIYAATILETPFNDFGNH